MNTRCTLLVLTAALLTGCGTTDSATFSPAGSASPAGLSGRVVSEAGAAQAGVRVIANERTTDAKVETLSASDGSFQLTLPAGVYDVGLDRTGDLQTSTCFYGPVTVNALEQRDLVLHSSNGKPPQHVSGRLFLQPGVPAAQRRVDLRSGHLPDPNAPPSVSATTTADGSFDLLLSSDRELGADVEVYDGKGNLDEFIDIGKLSKPCYVEFATELPVAANRLRSDEADFDLRADSSAPPSGFQLFSSLTTRASTGNGPAELLWTGGLLPVSKYTYQIFDGIQTVALQQQFNAYRGLVASGPLRVEKNGSWWWTYAVNIKPNQKSYWQFEDQTNAVYSLSVYLTFYTHKVSYDSKKPDIQGIATLDPLQ